MNATDIIARRIIGPFRPHSGPQTAAGHVRDHYRHFRLRRGMGAQRALKAALELPARYIQGVGYYGESCYWGAPYVHGSDTLRHCSDTDATGLRFLGYSDELESMSHTGWFTEDDGDNGETLRGAVWALPGRKGESRLLYGYRELEGRGEMNPGSAILCVSDVIREAADDSGDVPADALRDCARWGDSLAESVAEDAREYNAAYRLGQRAAERDAEAAEARRELLPLLAELRAERRSTGLERAAGKPGRPAICAALRSRVDSLLESIAKARRKRDAMWSGLYSAAEEAFAAGFMDEAADGFRRAVQLGYRSRDDWRGPAETNPCNG